MDRHELAAWLRLAACSGVGNAAARKLLSAFGLPQAIFNQSLTALSQVVGPAHAQALLDPAGRWLELEPLTWDWLHADTGHPGVQRHIAVLGDPEYPASLLAMEDPPLMLYMVGQVHALQACLPSSVAIVGSRNPTPQGEINARQFAHSLSDAGLAVVSGLALGVDGASHEGALAGGGVRAANGFATVAVVGTGLDRVYPARHRDLAHRIAQRGVIMSEFPLGTPPLQQNFPKRNRIIAGLSLGTLVVEAAVKSGSLITAKMAVDQGKEVFAIPGSIHSPQARGCHWLIRQGAKLVESAEDILEELQLPLPKAASTRGADLFSDEPEEDGTDNDADVAQQGKSLLELLGHDPVSLDALTARSGFSTGQLQAQLLELEMDGHVARIPGGLFQRVAMA